MMTASAIIHSRVRTKLSDALWYRVDAERWYYILWNSTWSPGANTIRTQLEIPIEGVVRDVRQIIQGMIEKSG